MSILAQLRLIPDKSCVGCAFPNYCGVANTNYSCGERPGTTKSAFFPDDPVAIRHLALLGGPDLLYVSRWQAIPDLPRVVHRIPSNQGAWLGELSLKFAAIGLADLRTLIRYHSLDAVAIRSRLGLAESSSLVINANGDDRLLDEVFANTTVAKEALARSGANLIISPLFSTWGVDPPFHHLISLKQSNRVFVAIQDTGIPVVPTIGGYHQAQWAQQAQWLIDNPEVDTVAFDLGTISCRSKSRDWSRFMSNSSNFLQQVQRPLTVIAIGLHQPTMIADVLEHAQQVVLIPSSPLFCAMNARIITKSGRVIAARHRQKLEIAKANLKMFEYYMEIAGRIRNSREMVD